MAGMNSMRSQATSAAAAMNRPVPRSPRPPGDATTPPTPGTPRGDLLVLLQPAFVSLPPDSRLPDSLVASMLADDPSATRQKMQQLFCTPPSPFYCEQERIEWAAANPWCNPTGVPLVTTPVFTDDVTRNAWIATHPHCPVPPPVLTDHTCTPGDPSCDPRAAGADTGGWIVSTLIGVAIGWGLMKLFDNGESRTNPRSLGSRSAKSGLDRFVDQYIETALWSSTDEDGNPLDRRFDEHGFAKNSLRLMKQSAESFYRAHQSDISSDPGRAGHDFWLTRNRHGAGFWDGDWPEVVGKRLTKAAHQAGEANLYIGDDGKVHLA